MKRLAAVPRKVKAQVIGLDVHKAWTVFCILDRRGRELESGRFRSRREDLIAFLKKKVGRRRSHIALEASRCSLWVYRVGSELLGEGRVHLAQANRIRAIANSADKTDLNDAWWLAYLAQEGRLPEAYVPPEQVLELRILTRERLAFVRRRTVIITRIKSHLAQLGEVVPGSTVTSDRARLFLAETAIGTPGARGRALRAGLEELDFVESMIEEWTQAVAELADQIEAVSVLAREIPGVGPILAATIVAEAGEIQRFHTAKAFARYSGLTPSSRSSAGRNKGGPISRQGSPYLRWALVMATVSCCRSRSGPGLAVGDWVRSKQKRIGIRAKGRVAGARKLSECIWRLFHHGECFDLARAFPCAKAA